MPRYLVERYFPQGLEAFLAKNPLKVIVEINRDTEVVWLHSYVTEDTRRIFCLCEAVSPEAIRRAARRTGFPVEMIHLVTVLEPHAFPQRHPEWLLEADRPTLKGRNTADGVRTPVFWHGSGMDAVAGSTPERPVRAQVEGSGP